MIKYIDVYIEKKKEEYTLDVNDKVINNKYRFNYDDRVLKNNRDYFKRDNDF